ncbi:hypothetical protein QJQ45_016877 [Haematococcus lacustris]|nr:hypothetical protein QJQ45_016877 [Haematococcus lacustris]
MHNAIMLASLHSLPSCVFSLTYLHRCLSLTRPLSSAQSPPAAPESSSTLSSADAAPKATEQPGPQVAQVVRSLEDVFGTAQSPSTSFDISAEQLHAVTAEQTPDDLDAASMSGPVGSTLASEQRTATAGESLISKRFGFAAVSGAVPSSREGDGDLLSVQPRLHPRRTFLPGQTYEPADLNPYSEHSRRTQERTPRARPQLADVQLYSDFRNVGFLENFLSPAGKLLPRSKTKLPPVAHRDVMRKIKTARNMALIAGEALFEKRHLRYLREREDRERRLAVQSMTVVEHAQQPGVSS